MRKKRCFRVPGLLQMPGLLLVLLPLAFLLLMRFVVVPAEGYPTWEAVRNLLIQNGEVRITFPESVTPIDAQCDWEDARTTIDGDQVIIKIGYSFATVSVIARTADGKVAYRFKPRKENNWNRIKYVPRDPDDPGAGFRKFENGVEEEAVDVEIRSLP